MSVSGSGNPSQRSGRWRGVNLGGWLVLEKWMTPSLFDGLQAEDETAWCIEQGPQATERLHRHWQTFITADDFAWLASCGINAIRIPVGHWLLGGDYPYHPSYGPHRYPYVSGGDAILDQAFSWAEQYGLAVVLDLHAAPGCQNGFDNGGIKDVCDWHTQQAFIDHSLQVLALLAERYSHSPALAAIEVLNEPRWDVPTAVLSRYTEQACQQIRRYCRPEQVAVIFHDGFRDFREYGSLLSQDANAVFDIHRYQCFAADDVNSDIFRHINKSVSDWKREADTLITAAGRRTVVGEWSLGLNPRFIELWNQQALDYPGLTMDAFQQDISYRAYAAAQLACFEKYRGWFFWSYKTETMPQWSFRDCVAQGWLPGCFD